MTNNTEEFDAIVHRQFDQERLDRIRLASTDPELVEAVMVTRSLTKPIQEVDFDLNEIMENISVRYSIDRETFRNAWIMCENEIDAQVDRELSQMLGYTATGTEIVGPSEALYE